MTTSPTVLQLHHCLLRLTGPDATRYLNGQVSNDVAALEIGHVQMACVTNHKGKLDAAPIYIHHPARDQYLIDAPTPLRETLFTRLDRYIIADDCKLTDVTGDYTLLHLTATTGSTEYPCPPETHHSPNPHRFGIPGTDLLLPPPHEIPPGDTPHLEVPRITAGIPAWGAELDTNTLPPEIPYLEAHAISYTKGCYIGQEVISRIRSVGRVNKTLRTLKTVTGSPPPPGDLALPAPLFSGETPAGTLTSLTASPDTGWSALGFVRRQFDQTAGLLHLGSGQNILSTTFEIGKTPVGS